MQLSRRAFLGGAAAAAIAGPPPVAAPIFPNPLLSASSTLSTMMPANAGAVVRIFHALGFAQQLQHPSIPESGGTALWDPESEDGRLDLASPKGQWILALHKAQQTGWLIDDLRNRANNLDANFQWIKEIALDPEKAAQFQEYLTTHPDIDSGLPITEHGTDENGIQRMPRVITASEVFEQALFGVREALPHIPEIHHCTTLVEVADVLQEKVLPAFFDHLPRLYSPISNQMLERNGISFNHSAALKHLLDKLPKPLRRSFKKIALEESPRPLLNIHAEGLNYELLDPIQLNVDAQGKFNQQGTHVARLHTPVEHQLTHSITNHLSP